MLDQFTQAYVVAALWSSTDDTNRPMDDHYSLEDIAPEALAQMRADCESFQKENFEDIAGDLEGAGHDFWFTRCRHGCGFWDGDWPKEVGERLTRAAHARGERWLYVGDDGLIYQQ